MITFRTTTLVAASLFIGSDRATGDTVEFTYEGTVLPGDAGFEVANPCAASCVHWIDDGQYVLNLDPGGGQGSYNYHRWITMPGGTPLPNLWVEWRFRSNYSYLQSSGWVLDDAFAFVKFSLTTGVDTFMWGDAAFDSSVCCAVVGMAMGEFHTFRYESAVPNHNFRYTDGKLLDHEIGPGSANAYVQFGGFGGGTGGGPYPDLTDTWDFLRYGLIEFGEVVTAANPPFGYVDPRQNQASPSQPQGIDRFTVTFDQPNGLHIAQITVESTAPPALKPSITWVTRPDGESEGTTWEVRLDKRLPPGHRTRFTISDVADATAAGAAGATSVVEYAFLPGDVNQSETVSSADVLALVGAINAGMANALYHDINRSGTVASADILRLVQLLNGVNTSQPWNGVSLPPWP